MASSPRIEELRKKFEENPRRYFAPLANEYRKAGDVQQAISICREYLPQQPGHMSGHIVFGQALYEARNFEEAKAVFETALSLDPENLIALRHLGDISLILNDSEGARTWYTRVLEADPRNEEIQAQLATIEKSSSAAAPAPEATASVAPAATAATVVIEAVSVPEKKAVTATSPTAEINLDAILPAAAQPPAAPSPAAPPPTAPPEASAERLAGLEATSAGDAEAPIGSFSLDGLETTSMSGESAPPPAPLADLDFGEPTPRAEPPAEQLEQLEQVVALELDTAPPPPSFSSVTTVEVRQRDVPAEPPALDLDLSSMAPPAPTPVAEPAPSPEPPAGETDPFVTETMAELYVQQGHLEEAERVYRALLAQRPGDAGLQEKLDALRSPAPAHSESASQDSRGPTIGELLAAIAARRPGHRPDWPGARVEAFGSAQDAMDPAPSAPPAPSAGQPEPARTDGLSGALALADPSGADQTAAIVLSRAFSRNGDAGGSSSVTGEPARAATDELSLRTVFNEPAPPPSSFSFEQFFAQRPPSEPGAVPQGQAVESPEDVAHFTQWLEGLKKR